MPTVRVESTIAAPPDSVYNVLTDWRKNQLWELELRSYTPVTEDPFHVGSRMRWVREVNGRQVSGVQDVIELVPGRRVVTDIPTKPLRFRSVMQLEPVASGNRTLLRAELTMRPSGLLRLLTPVLIKNLRLQAITNLKALRDLVEDSADDRQAS
jgi:uncharacterized protein YndB with AHSA1/START domain